MVKIYIIVQYAESLRCFTLTDDERFLSRFGVFSPTSLHLCYATMYASINAADGPVRRAASQYRKNLAKRFVRYRF